jgi:RNA polymerase sigma-70 factor (ECF subfamily)
VDDRALASAILAGDAGALRALVERDTTRLLRACTRITGDVDAAADAVQDAFVMALAALPTYRGDGPLVHWLLRIAIRQAMRQRPARSVDLAAADRVDDRQPDPADQMEAKEHDRLLRGAVADLPEAYREVIVLRYFGEVDPPSIASLLGVPLETVRTRLRRGLARLRHALSEEAAA